MKILIKLRQSMMTHQDPKQIIRTAFAHISHQFYIQRVNIVDGASQFDNNGLGNYGLTASVWHPFSSDSNPLSSSLHNHQDSPFHRQETAFNHHHTSSMLNASAGSSMNQDLTIEVICQRQGSSDISSEEANRLITEAISLRGCLTLINIEDIEGLSISRKIEEQKKIDAQNAAIMRSASACSAIPTSSTISSFPRKSIFESRYSHFSIVQKQKEVSILIVDDKNTVFAKINNLPASIAKAMFELQSVVGDTTIQNANDGKYFVLQQAWLIQVASFNPKGITELANILHIPETQLRQLTRIPEITSCSVRPN